MNQSYQLSDNYLNNHVFEEIEYMMEFYDKVSYTSFRYLSTGTQTIFNYESYVYLSLQGTLDSIHTLLKKGRITDAYVLTRKLFDDVLTYLYLEVVKKEEYDSIKQPIVEDINNWTKSKFRIPKVESILKKIKQSEYTKDIYPLFGWDTLLKKIREFLDDSVHSNRFALLLLNCNRQALYNREKHLQTILSIINQIFTIHLSFILVLDPEYLIDPVIFDYIDLRLAPPIGSETKFAPFAQNAFDKYIATHQSLATVIKQDCFLQIE